MYKTEGPMQVGHSSFPFVMPLVALAVMVTDVGAQAIAAEAPLVPGDAIRLAFWRDPDLSGEYAIDERGSVVLPILGTRSVTGTPAAELKQRLLDDYGAELRDRNDVQVTLLRRVRVLGAVNSPGLYHVDPTMSLGDAIALAGGATNDGKLDGIRIVRGGQEVRTSLDQRMPVMAQIRSGDQILVPERSWFSRNGVFLLGGVLSATAIIVSRAAF